MKQTFSSCVLTFLTFLIIQKTAAQEQHATPAQLVDALHSAFGKHEARAVHAKGVFFAGRFTPSSEASKLTKAFHLQKEGSDVTVRFSDFTGIPDIPDNIGPANPRGMAIKFTMADGRSTDVIAHSFNGFPTATSDEFRVFLLAVGASGPDAKQPTSLDSFLASHPIAKTFLTTQRLPASYATIPYFAVNSFKATNGKGQTHFFRFQFIPEIGIETLTPDQFSKQDKNYLISEIGKRIAARPVRFSVYAQIAEEGDVIENPSIAWPDKRKKILLGVIEVNKLIDNTTQADKALSFNPNNLPEGIETADPMLTLRAKAYPVSVRERQ